MKRGHAHINPAAVRKFASHLKAFKEKLEGESKQLRGRFNELASGEWNDEVHDRFAEEFSQTMMTIAKFINLSEQHIPFLLKKARSIEESYFKG
jgi:uncharacterized protein YukE